MTKPLPSISSPDRRLFCRAAFATTMSLAALPARAQAAYPSGPIKIVVPSSAGGVTDGVARALAQWLSQRWNVSFVVENVPGGNGVIGAGSVARSKPDGKTLFLTPDSILVMNPHLYKNMAYDPVKDFEPISVLFKAVQVWIVNPSVPVKSVAELIQYSKANPSKLSYASTGTGTSTHLNMELIKQNTGLDVLHVPYKGGAPALQAVVAGDVSMMMIAGNLAQPFVKAGRLRALAVMSEHPVAMFPGVPSFAESGMGGYKAQPWFGLMAPAKTPPAVIEKLNAGLLEALRDKAFRDRFLTQEGLEPVGSSPAEFAGLIRNDMAKWGVVVKTTGAHID